MADTTRIEDLEIAVKTTSDSAISSLGELENALKGLQSSTTGLKLKSVINQINSLQEAVNKITANASQRLKELSDSVNSLANVRKLNINKSTANTIQSLGTATAAIPADVFSKINGLSTGLESLSNIGKATGLNSFLRSLKQLPEVVSAINTIPPDFTTRMQGLQGAFHVKDMGDASKMAALVNSLAKLPTITKALNDSDMDQFAGQVQRVADAMRPLADEAAKVYVSLKWLPGIVDKVIASGGKLPSQIGGINKLSGKYTELGQILRSVERALRRVAAVSMELFDKTNENVEALNLFRVVMQDSTDDALRFARTVQDVIGIDMTEWMQAQGSIAQVFRGFGVANEDIQMLSQNLTQLGYDIASVFNQDTELTLSRLQSAISGQVKGMREYGVDVSIAAIKQTALELGITKNVSAMTQAEKAMLRYATIMRNTTNIQGDLARTIVTPANALRILRSQFEIMQRSLGKIVSVIATAGIPVFQALTQAVTFAADAIANLFGYSLQDIDYSGLTNVSLGAEDAEDALNGAAGAAKKLKDYVMGFDELNVINPADAAGGGLGGGAMSGMSFELPDYSYDFLGGLEPMTKEWKDTIQELITDITQIGVVAGGSFLILKNWEKLSPIYKAVGKTISSTFLDMLPESAQTGVTAAITKAKETIKFATKGLAFAAVIALQFALQFEAFKNIAQGRGDFSDWITATIGTILGAAASTVLFGNTGLAISIITSITALIAGITFSKYEKGAEEYRQSELAAQLDAVGAEMAETVTVTKQYFVDIEAQTDISGFRNTISEAQGQVDQLFTLLNQKGQLTATDLRSINDLISSINSKNLGDIQLEYDKLTGEVNISKEAINEQFNALLVAKERAADIAALEIAQKGYNDILEMAPQLLNNYEFAQDKLREAQQNYDAVLRQHNDILKHGGSLTDEQKAKIGNLEEAVADAKDTYAIAEQALEGFYSMAQDSDGRITGQRKSFEELSEKIIDSTKDIRDFSKTLEKIPEEIKSKINVSVTVKANAGANVDTAKATISSIKIGKTFAQGGFPSRGDLFIANENGAEMIGSFGGKPAVANNQQIIEGVASGVAKANQDELVLLREQNELLRQLLIKPSSVRIGEREFGDAVVSSINQRTYELGDNGIRW